MSQPAGVGGTRVGWHTPKRQLIRTVSSDVQFAGTAQSYEQACRGTAVDEMLARVLSAGGRPQDALAERRQALELWERYDYTSESNRVRALLAEHRLD